MELEEYSDSIDKGLKIIDKCTNDSSSIKKELRKWKNLRLDKLMHGQRMNTHGLTMKHGKLDRLLLFAQSF